MVSPRKRCFALPPRVKPHASQTSHYGFSVWMAGGGLKGGIVHGATDKIGFHAVESPHYVTDVHATLLHQLGLHSHHMHVPEHKRLDYGEVIREIVA